ncbi:phosphotransferase [Bacillus salacetis]|uniref:phosphotransferase n=1 Tax=Bacillus salacetis TaxID=2315464 RepID=UPI003B9E1E88
MMISKINDSGGDGFQYRLLLFLQNKLGDKDIRLEEIKKDKWLLHTDQEFWFLKLYPNKHKFQLQKNVTEALRLEGFKKVPGYHPIHETDKLECDGKTAGLTEWIKTNGIFSYLSPNERQNALSVLNEFHQYSRKVLSKGKFPALPKQKLTDKWGLRLEEFIRNKQKLSVYVPPAVIDTYIQYGEKALQQLIRQGFSNDYCILHGDVAHHNFLRDQNNQLFIIDLDLITEGPPEIDYIQFANRIFPYINWSLAELWKHDPFPDYKGNRTFLYALLFPSDVFREWNRFFREGPGYQKNVWSYLMALTVHQFHARMVCCRDIQKSLN